MHSPVSALSARLLPQANTAAAPQDAANAVNLPAEILFDIFARLDAESLTAVSMQSQEWNDVACDPRLSLHRRRLLGKTYGAFRKRPALGEKVVLRALRQHHRDVGSEKFVRDSVAFFADAAWLERRSQPFSRALFAGVSKLLYQHVPNFRGALLAQVHTVLQTSAAPANKAPGYAASLQGAAKKVAGELLGAGGPSAQALTVLSLPRSQHATTNEMAMLGAAAGRIAASSARPKLAWRLQRLRQPLDKVEREDSTWLLSTGHVVNSLYRLLRADGRWKQVVQRFAASVVATRPHIAGSEKSAKVTQKCVELATFAFLADTLDYGTVQWLSRSHDERLEGRLEAFVALLMQASTARA